MVEHVKSHLFKHRDQKEHGRNFYCSYQDPQTGRWKCFSCRTQDKSKAAEYAFERLRQMHAPPDHKCQESPSATDNKLIPRSLLEFGAWLADNKITKRKRRRYTSKSKKALVDSVRQLAKHAGDKFLHEFTDKECETLIITDSRAERTSEKHYLVLRDVFNEAIKRNHAKRNPFDSFELPVLEPDEDAWMDRCFTAEELSRLLDHLSGRSFQYRRLGRMLFLASETGLRLAELRNLSLSWIQESKRTLRVPSNRNFRTKNGKPRSILISFPALAAIRDQKADNAAHPYEAVRSSTILFPNRRGTPLSESSVEGLFSTVRQALLGDRRPVIHGLRHAFVTTLGNMGFSDRQIMTVSGHRSASQVSRYCHIEEQVLEPMRKAFDARDRVDSLGHSDADKQAPIDNQQVRE